MRRLEVTPETCVHCGLWWSILARKILRLPLLISNWLLGEANAFTYVNI